MLENPVESVVPTIALTPSTSTVNSSIACSTPLSSFLTATSCSATVVLSIHNCEVQSSPSSSPSQPKISFLSSASFSFDTPHSHTPLRDIAMSSDDDTEPGRVTPSGCSSSAIQWYGFKLIGDNLDKCIKPREMREDHQNRMLHCFQLYAVRDRLNLTSFSDKEPTFKPVDFKSEKFLPSATDTEQLVHNIATLVVRILCKHLPFFNQLDKLFSPHIPHKHSKEMAQVSEVVIIQIIHSV